MSSSVRLFVFCTLVSISITYGRHDGSLAKVGGGMLKRCGNKLVELLQDTCYAEYGNTNLGRPNSGPRTRRSVWHENTTDSIIRRLTKRSDTDGPECENMVECCCRDYCSKTYRLTYCDPLSISALL